MMHLYEERLIRRIGHNCFLNAAELEKLAKVAENTPEANRTKLLESIASESDKRELATRLALQKKIREW